MPAHARRHAHRTCTPQESALMLTASSCSRWEAGHSEARGARKHRCEARTQQRVRGRERARPRAFREPWRINRHKTGALIAWPGRGARLTWQRRWPWRPSGRGAGDRVPARPAQPHRGRPQRRAACRRAAHGKCPRMGGARIRVAWQGAAHAAATARLRCCGAALRAPWAARGRARGVPAVQLQQFYLCLAVCLCFNTRCRARRTHGAAATTRVHAAQAARPCWTPATAAPRSTASAAAARRRSWGCGCARRLLWHRRSLASCLARRRPCP